MNKKPYIAVIGLGYIGYPLALAFGKFSLPLLKPSGVFYSLDVTYRSLVN
jgi:hypothetical protein